MELVIYCLFLLPQDGNGYIDENELDALLKDLCEKNKQVTQLLCHLFLKQTFQIHPEVTTHPFLEIYLKNL